MPDSPGTLPNQMIEALTTTGNPRDLRDFALALSLLESPAVGLLVDGRYGRFTSLPRKQREAVLRRWATHPLPVLRKAFQALKRLASFLCYASADSPAKPAIGYSIDSSSPAAPPLFKVDTIPNTGHLTADAVVIGSGGGGGVAAAILASKGLHVIVLEQGGHVPESELGHGELDGMQRLYLDRGMTATQDLSVAILAGSALGGGTLVNFTASLAPPDWLRSEWESDHGLTGISGADFEQSVRSVLERLCVTTRWSAVEIQTSAGRLLSGSRALGYHAEELPRNVMGCGEDCGTCHFGCRRGAKQSTTRTYLADAARAGAQLIPGARVERVLIERGRTTGVTGISGGRPFIVRAPRVVLAAGAIGSPAVLLRSGIENPNIGHHLHLHPVVAVMGSYEEPAEPWRGRQLSAYCQEFQRIDGNYGFLMEVAPAHPGTFAMFSPWRSGAQYQADLEEMNKAGVFIAVTRDRDSGRVTIDRAGHHKIDYAISAYDRRHLLLGQQEALKIHRAAGAVRVGTLHSGYNVLEGAQSTSFDAFLEGTWSLPSGPNQLLYLSAHQMGTCRMGRSPRTAVADPNGQVYGVKGLYVCDTSAFPSASGVNPMITVMSLAGWIAGQID